MRLGERGFGDCGFDALSWSSLVSCCSLPDTVGGGIDCGDKGVFTLLKNGLLAEAPCADAKSKPPRANALLFSDCLRNCSNSGFCSTGIIRGETAAVERTLEVGGLQLPRMCCAALEEKWSALELMARPK